MEKMATPLSLHVYYIQTWTASITVRRSMHASNTRTNIPDIGPIYLAIDVLFSNREGPMSLSPISLGILVLIGPISLVDQIVCNMYKTKTRQG